MILDLPKFIQGERPFWTELETRLNQREEMPDRSESLVDAQRLHYLYERASGDLGQINTFAAEPEVRAYLEALVARAYGELHRPTFQRTKPRAWFLWFFITFPTLFQKHVRVFALAALVTLVGMGFGGGVILFDRDAKSILLPFDHLLGEPADRVRSEEQQGADAIGEHGTFSSFLMTHNTRVAIFTLALGMTAGIGTLVVLFYNGVILGAVCADYILAGQTEFLIGWLLPHGSFEIPAILIAGQAGLLLGKTVLSRESRQSLGTRLRNLAPELTILIGGVAVLLVWAGIVESFFSQYHEPVLPYFVKIVFGATQLALLAAFLFMPRRATSDPGKTLVQAS